jgi:DNA modification methylase
MKAYYQDEAVTIYHADCYECDLPACDLLLIDPPYEISTRSSGLSKQCDYLQSIEMNDMHRGFDETILERFGNWMCFCSLDQLSLLMVMAEERKRKGGRRMVLNWLKPDPAPLCNGNYLPDTEYIVHAFEPSRLFGKYDDKHRYFLRPAMRQWNKFGHPTTKPLDLMQWLIRLGTRDGDTVMDCFCGTGTTLVAAKSLGRRAIGIERQECWCETAARRCAAMTGRCEQIIMDAIL